MIVGQDSILRGDWQSPPSLHLAKRRSQKARKPIM
jgi:hypothetical protein